MEKAAALMNLQRSREGFITFLSAIESSPESEKTELFDAHMEALLPLYLASKENEEGMVRLEKELIERESYVESTHPLFIIKGCVLANKGQFSSLFTQSFRPILAHSDSYLAWKVRGMLYIKVFEASSGLEERICYKSKALECFMRAYQKIPEDMGLALKILFFTQGMEKEEECYALKIFKSARSRSLKKEWMSKSHLQQVIREFLDIKMYEEAQELMVTYDTLFGYSRAIDEMQIALSRIEKDQDICESKKERY